MSPVQLRRHHLGFTLLESLVAVGIVAILVMAGAPFYQDATLGSQLRSAANDLMASVYFARAEAIKRNTTITLCVSTDGVGCGAGDWNAGWIVLAGAALTRELGAALFISLVVGGQVLCSLALDHFGLMGLAVHPRFPQQPFLYAMHTHREGGRITNRVIRLTVAGDAARFDRVIVAGARATLSQLTYLAFVGLEHVLAFELTAMLALELP